MLCVHDGVCWYAPMFFDELDTHASVYTVSSRITVLLFRVVSAF